MADLKHPSAPAVEPPLKIVIYRHHFVRWDGTRAQLEAEGLVPCDGLQWPKDNCDATTWAAAGMRHTLMRCRPDGWRGSLAESDYWALVVQPDAEFCRVTQLQKLQREELLRVALAASPHGRSMWTQQLEAFNRARKDAPFQQLLAAVLPAQTRRGRRSGGQVTPASEGRA